MAYITVEDLKKSLNGNGATRKGSLNGPADVEALMAYMYERVRTAYNVVLEPEVHIVGEEG